MPTTTPRKPDHLKVLPDAGGFPLGAPVETVWSPLAEARDETLRAVDLFLRTCLRRDPVGAVGAQALYGAYAAWSWGRGLVPATQTRFGRHVGLFVPKVLAGGRFHYRGCALDHPALAAGALTPRDGALLAAGPHTAASLRAADAVQDILADADPDRRVALSAAIARALV